FGGAQRHVDSQDWPPGLAAPRVKIEEYGCSRTSKGALRASQRVASRGGAGMAGPRWGTYAPQAPGPGCPADGVGDPDVPVRTVHSRVDVHAPAWRPAHRPHP